MVFIQSYQPPKTELEKYEDELHQQITGSLVINSEISSEQSEVTSDVSELLENDEGDEINEESEWGQGEDEQRVLEQIQSNLDAYVQKYFEQINQLLSKEGAMEIKNNFFSEGYDDLLIILATYNLEILNFENIDSNGKKVGFLHYGEPKILNDKEVVHGEVVIDLDTCKFPDIHFPYSTEKITHIEKGEVLGREMLELTRGAEKHNEQYCERYIFIEAVTGKPLFIEGTNHIIKHNDSHHVINFEGNKYYEVSLDGLHRAYVDKESLKPLTYNNRLIYFIDSIGHGKYKVNIYPNKKELSEKGSHRLEDIILDASDIKVGVNEDTYTYSDKNFEHNPDMYSKETLGEKLYQYYQFLNDLYEYIDEDDYTKIKMFLKYTTLITDIDRENMSNFLKNDENRYFMQNLVKEALLNISPTCRLSFFKKHERYLGENGRDNFLEDVNQQFFDSISI